MHPIVLARNGGRIGGYFRLGSAVWYAECLYIFPLLGLVGIAVFAIQLAPAKQHFVAAVDQRNGASSAPAFGMRQHVGDENSTVRSAFRRDALRV